MKNEIPKPFKNQFKTFEEYRKWSVEKSKLILKQAFEKNISNERTLED